MTVDSVPSKKRSGEYRAEKQRSLPRCWRSPFVDFDPPPSASAWQVIVSILLLVSPVAADLQLVGPDKP
jgi:hypothetical protein